MKFFRKSLLIIVLFLITSLVFSCGNKKKEESAETGANVQRQEPEIKMDDERYIEFVLEYRKLSNEMSEKSEELKGNPELIEKYNQRVKKLEEKYPNAASYPSTLSQEEQDKLGKKVDEALKALEEETSSEQSN
jgi:archaellum component FlaC